MAIHGAQGSDSYYASSSGGGDTGTYSSPAPASYTPSGASYTPSTVPSVVSAQSQSLPLGYQGGSYNPSTGETTGGSPSAAQMEADRAASGFAPGGNNFSQISVINTPVDSPNPYINVGVPYTSVTPATMDRSDYRDPSTLGDSYTRDLVNKGATLEQALYTQQQAATSAREKSYYEMELRSALQNNIALSSEYHYQSKMSGLPTAPNPFEYVSDLSLTAGGKGSFSPYGSFNQADIESVARAKSEGDVGPYNSKNLHSFSSTYGDLTLNEQQAIAKRVAATRPDYSIDESRLNKLPLTKDFGYGGKTFTPMMEIQAIANQLESNEQALKLSKSMGISPAPAGVTTYTESKFLSSGPDVISNGSGVTLLLPGELPKYLVEGNVFKGSAGVVALSGSLSTQQASIDAMLKGKLNEKGEFTGTQAEFNKVSAATEKYQIDKQKYTNLYDAEYAAYPTESKNTFQLSIIPKADIFGKPVAQKSTLENVVSFGEGTLDAAGGFIRGVGSMTKTAWTPNIIDFMGDIPGMKYVNPSIMLSERPGAQEREGTTFASKGEIMPYGAYSEASSQFSSEYLQPIVGSPAKYEGYTDMWEKEFNKPGISTGDKIFTGLNIVGSSANAYFVKDPGEVPIIATQAAVIEVTGVFGAIGKGSEFVLGKGANLLRVSENPVVQKGISFIGNYGVDLAFGTAIAGSATSNEKGEWFKTTEPSKVLRNVGPLGVQLVSFTAGTYGADYATRPKVDKGYIDADFTLNPEARPIVEPARLAAGPKIEEPFTPNKGPSQTTSGPSGPQQASRPSTAPNNASPSDIFKSMIEGNLPVDAFAKYEAAYKMRTYADKFAKTGRPEFKEYYDQYSSLKPKGEILNPYTGYVEYRPNPKTGRIEYVADRGLMPSNVKANMIPRAAFEGVQSGNGGFRLKAEQVWYPKDYVTKMDITKTKTDVAVSKKGTSDIEVYRKPIDIEIYRKKTDVSIYKKPAGIDVFKKPKTSVEIFKKPPAPAKKLNTDIILYKRPGEVSPFKKANDIVPFKKPGQVVPVKKPEITPFKKIDDLVIIKKTEIVPVKKTDIIPTKKDEISPFKRTEDPVKIRDRERPKPDEKIGDLKTGGGGVLPGLPFPLDLGGAGAAGGGRGGGGKRSITEFFKYGFGALPTMLSFAKKKKKPTQIIINRR